MTRHWATYAMPLSFIRQTPINAFSLSLNRSQAARSLSDHLDRRICQVISSLRNGLSKSIHCATSARPRASYAAPHRKVHLSPAILSLLTHSFKPSDQRESLNRSQYGSCSTGYNTLTSMQVVCKRSCAPTLNRSDPA